MSESNDTQTPATSSVRGEETRKAPDRSLGVALTSLLGILAIIVIAFLVNWLVRQVPALNRGTDLTEHKIFTLSEGTKTILDKIPAIEGPEGDPIPVEIRYYFTHDLPSVTEEDRRYDRVVEDLLNRYRRASNGRITVKTLNPKMDSDEEDAAVTDGIIADMEGKRQGIAISFLEKQIEIPRLTPARETLLEYDISRAITEVSHDEKSVIGLISGLPIAGSPMAMMPPQFGGGGPPAWIAYNELGRSYEVQDLGTSVEAIDPEEVDTLLVIHPTNLSDATLFAIDQYLLKGGNLLICLDPMSVVAQMSQPQPNPMMPQQAPPAETASNLERLLTAWGVGFSSEVVADRTNMTPLRDGRSMLGLLTLGPDAVNADDTLTSQISDLLMVLAGSFTGEGGEGLEYSALINSSDNSMMVNAMDAEQNSDSMVNTFVSDDTAKPLAIRLRGIFPTAFAAGNPTLPAPEALEAPEAPEAAEEGEDATDSADEVPAEDTASAQTEALARSAIPGNVILVGDVDWLHDQFTVQQLNMGGQTVAIPVNGNLGFFLNAVDQMAGDDSLIEVRSRASSRRPFGKINELEAEADQAMRAEMEEFETKRQEAQARITEIQSQRSDDPSATFFTAEQEEELEKFEQEYAETGKQLRETRKELRKDIDSLRQRIAVANIAIVPLLVAFLGLGVAAYRKAKTGASN